MKALSTTVLTLVAGSIAAVTLAANAPKIPVPQEDGPAEHQLPGQPMPPAPGTYGLDPRNGAFRHPGVTPASDLAHPFPGSLDYLDLNEYRLNTKVEVYLPHVVATGHSWGATIDLDGRRYLYDYYSNGYKVFDTTDVRNSRLVAEKKLDFSKGEHPFGPFVARWNEKLRKTIAVQCYQVPRYGVLENKYEQPEKVQVIRQMKLLRGFRIFEVTEADPAKWTLLSATTLDPFHKADEVPQQGSGCLDVPTYFGDKYLFVAGAPDDSYSLQEYPSILYSAAHVAYDISDPANPKRLGRVVSTGSTRRRRRDLSKESALRQQDLVDGCAHVVLHAALGRERGQVRVHRDGRPGLLHRRCLGSGQHAHGVAPGDAAFGRRQ